MAFAEFVTHARTALEKARLRPARLTLLLLTCVPSLLAQTNTGGITGVVYDQTMAVIPGASVTAVDVNRGVERSAATSDVGEFVLSLVDPGVYRLEFRASGFSPLTIEDLDVRVGETVRVSPQLSVEAADEQVVVSADSARSAIEPQRVQQSDHIDSVRIENLPINRRDYLDLALLTPGVVDTNYMANATDRRIQPTPTSGLGIGGTNGRGNTFMIDGLDNGYNTGSVRSSISQEAVHEFQVNRNSFSTEQGGAPGGTLNIVTKGGTNDLHGTLFGVIRERSFQARNYFDSGKSPFTRTQSGASIGGPIERNKTFLYGAYERLDRHESRFVPLLDDPSYLTSLTDSQQALADVLRGSAPAAFLPLVDQIATVLTPASNPAVTPLFEENSGVFPYGEQRQQLLARFDHAFRDGHNLFLRGNWTGLDVENFRIGSLIGHSAGSYSTNRDFALALGDTYVFNPRWVSETRLGFAYHDLGVYPNDPFGPGISIAGFGNFGRDLILPARILERAYQVRQNLIRISGRQTIKFGFDLNPVRDWARSETFLGGRFIFAEAIPLSFLIDNAAGPGLSQALKGLLTASGQPLLASYVDRPISALQSFALGLPTVYQQGFGNPYWKGWANRINYFVEDAIRVTPKFLLTLGLRHEFELKTRFPRDYNNLGPRGGFAWSPNSKTVIRGAYGFYYSRIDGQIVYVNDLLGEAQQIFQVFIPLTGLPGIQSTLSGGPLTSAEIFQTAQSRGIIGERMITLDDLALHGLQPGQNFPLRAGFRVAEDTVSPYSQQGSLEIQREVGGYALSVGYNYNRGVHLIRPLDTNVYKAGEMENGRPIVGFRNPLILQDNVYGSWGRSYYHAMIAQVKKRFSQGFTLSAHHTWSKFIDENTDYNSSYEPHLQWDARDELALSHYHRGHRFVAHAVGQSPWKAARGRGFGHNLLADFTLSGIVVARSFAPFNLNAGFDTIGDRHTDTHRPWGLGRNVGRGPAFFGMDMRLTRTFPLTERLDLRIVAEGFNILNRTNFRGVNGIVGDVPLEELPSDLVGRRGPVTEPFSFVSAFDPRQFQFSVRLAF